MESVKRADSKSFFLAELRKLLQQLYDPATLRRSPLIALFGLKSQPNPHTALRRILIEAIQALKPTSDVPPYANSWRIYHILQNRYVEHFSQQALASNLGLSIRQLRRQERLAEEALVDYLWQKYNLEATIQYILSPSKADQASDSENHLQKGEELEWLSHSLPDKIIRVEEIIEFISRTADPLIRSLNVQIKYTLPESLPPLTGKTCILKQGLLNLVSAMMQIAPCRVVYLAFATDAEEMRIELQTTTCQFDLSSSKSIVAQIEMAHKLIEMFGGRLEIAHNQADHLLTARVLLPISANVPILVIDDNADTLRLFERYLSGSRYRFIGVREPEQALRIIENLTPCIILLDIMLPNIDGWDALGRLREHPRTRHVPVIVCTILPQEQLALMLGASAFLRKPVSREQLLTALDQQLAELERASK